MLRIVTNQSKMKTIDVESIVFSLRNVDQIVMLLYRHSKTHKPFISVLIEKRVEHTFNYKYGFAAMTNLRVRSSKLSYVGDHPKEAIMNAIKCGREVVLVSSSELCRVVFNLNDTSDFSDEE